MSSVAGFGYSRYLLPLFEPRSTQQLLTVVLLHDINHFPFLHIFQESNIPDLDRLQVLDLFCDGDATGERKAKKPSVYDLLADIGIDPDRFKRLVLGKHHEQKGKDLEVDQTINSVVNSGVDVDKLSYLLLDSHFTGVRYGGGIDFPTVLKAATVGRLYDKSVHIAFNDAAMHALENVVMTRFWNFRSLYWHHTNRAVMAMILHVVRRLYAEQRRSVQDYLRETMWMGDMEAVRFLDKSFDAEFGQPSILHGLAEDRGRIYKRMYTVRAGMGDLAEDDFYAACRSLDYASEVRLRENISDLLREFLPTGGGSTVISSEDILIDIPRREMDSGGAVYVASENRLVPLTDLSDPIRSITTNYERLTKRVRIFFSPRLADIFGAGFRTEKRDRLKQALKVALAKTLAKSQVQ